MTNFLNRIEPHLLNDDPFVQHFAVHILEGTFLATPKTLFTALQAFDKGVKTIFPSSILPHIRYLPIDENGCEELINRIKHDNDNVNQVHYLRLLLNASTGLLLQYKEDLKPYLKNDYLVKLQELKDLDVEGLFMELAEVTNILDEDDYHNQALFDWGKRIIRELIDRNEIPQWEIENGIRNDLQENEYMTYNGIYSVYMAGELCTKSVLPELIQILKTDDGDIVLEEVTNTLVKIGIDEVIEEVEKIALNDPAYFYTIDILAKIKNKKAEQALMRLMKQTKDITIKTLIADALCQQLSVDAIPMILKLLETGYDATLMDLEESLYANLVINQINHPYLEQMKQNLIQREQEFNDRKLDIDKLSKPTPVKTEKIGRNDPCPCGSGKKYKKCCM